MSCLKFGFDIPDPPFFFAEFATPSFDFDPTLCCKFHILAVPPISLFALPLDPAIIATAVALMRANIAIVTTYLDNLPPECPRE